MAAINDENNRTTVDEPPYNEDPGIASDIFPPSNSKMYANDNVKTN